MTVKDDGSLKLAEGTPAPDGYLIEVDKGNVTTVAVSNKLTEIPLTKKSTDGAMGLAGAEFTLTPVNGSDFAGDFKGQTSLTLVSQSDGSAKVRKADGTLADFKGVLVAGNTYTLTETKAPAGYELKTGSLTFSLNADGTAVAEGYQNADDSPFAVTEGGLSITASDEPVRLAISKTGTEEGTPELTGAEYTVSGKFVVDGAVEQEASTHEGLGADDFAQLAFAQGETYEITETKAPAGYQTRLDTDKFTVATDGTIKRADGTTPVYGFSFSGETVSVTDEPVVVTFQKQDADRNPLSGAVFHISGAAWGSNCTLPQATDDAGQPIADTRVLAVENGSVAVTGLVAGTTYTLTELSSPAGYLVLSAADGTSGTYQFSVSDDGSTISEVSSAIVDATGSVALDGSTNTVTATDVLTSLTITKQSTEAGEDGTYAKLPGAEFSLTPAGGSSFAGGSTEALALTTDENGEVGVTGQLVVGNTYTLVETKAPTGYVQIPADKPLTFTMLGNGDVRVVTGDATYYSVDASGEVTVFTGTVSDEPTHLDITKLAAGTTTALANATFELAPVEGSAFADGGTDALTLTTGADGKVILPSATLVADGGNEYRLVEVTAPKGYELATPVLFTVGTDNRIQVTSGSAEAAGGIAALSVEDARVTVDVKKLLQGTDEVVPGVEFKLTGAFYDEAGEKTADSMTLATGADDGTAHFSGLAAGESYVLTEESVPGGYTRLTGSYSFTVNADGTLSYDATEGDFAASLSGSTVTVSDPQVELRVQKTGGDPAAMAGATYALTGVFADSEGAEPESLTLTVGTDGYATTEGGLIGRLVVGNAYTLAETKAPAGYELDASPFEFAVNVDGSLEVTAQPASYEVEAAARTAASPTVTTTVTQTDEPVKVTPTTPSASADTHASPIPKMSDPTQTSLPGGLAGAGVALVALALALLRRRPAAGSHFE